MRQAPVNSQRWRLRKALLSHASELLKDWRPNGVVRGKTFSVGSIAGEPGESLKVSLATGGWRDWNGSESWIDLISLYAAIKSLSYTEAEQQLLDDLRRANRSDLGEAAE